MRSLGALVASALAVACSSASEAPRVEPTVDVAIELAVAPSASAPAAAAGCGLLRLAKRVGADDSEAKNVLGTIERSAIASFEREAYDPKNPSPDHVLCKSARPFPASPPRCGEAVPVVDAWFEGKPDADAGWSCLRFSMTTPTKWRFGYVAGGPYRGLDRGAPDPGPRGFQAFAERDADGDGKTALIVATARMSDDGRYLRRDEQLFIVDEDE